MIVGEEPGESKAKKARECGTKIISEDDLLEMIRASKPLAKSSKDDDDDDVDMEEAKPKQPAKSKSPSPKKPVFAPKKADDGMLWSEKYRPTTATNLLGNAANVTNIKQWLQNYGKGTSAGDTSKKSKKSDEPKKSIVISGPPGIGKTTCAKIACKECGYETIELNASDARSKNTLKETVEEMINNRSISQYFGTAEVKKRNICLIMDEVDGMSSGDRGGVAELVQMIKASKVLAMLCTLISLLYRYQLFAFAMIEISRTSKHWLA